MMKRVGFIIIIFVLVNMNLVVAENDEFIKLVKYIYKKQILILAENSIIINAVKAANKEAKKTLEEIKRLDNLWLATDGNSKWIKGFLENPCADFLKKIKKRAVTGDESLYSEIFIMDKQGCIVAETDKTTDYWQGDEDKFIKPFTNNDIFIGESSFDESTQTYSIQISVPVFDPETKKVIGVITIGLNLNKLAESI